MAADAALDSSAWPLLILSAMQLLVSHLIVTREVKCWWDLCFNTVWLRKFEWLRTKRKELQQRDLDDLVAYPKFVFQNVPLTAGLWFSGNGVPVFTGESDCTYYFDWQTAYACVKEKEDLLCQVTDHKKRYDLSPLTRYPGRDEITCVLGNDSNDWSRKICGFINFIYLFI